MTTSDQMLHRGGVLVIDDNPAICTDFRKILQGDTQTSHFHEARAGLFADTLLDRIREHVEVHCADQGQTGLEMVQDAIQRGSPYAVAFVDMLMPPGWDGIETIAHLWQVDPELEIVICTAFTDLLRDRLRPRLEHGDKLLVLLKPFDEMEVRQLVHALTLKGQLAQQAKQQVDAFIDRVEQGTRELRELHDRLQVEMTQRQQIAETLARQDRDLARLQADLQQVTDAVAYDLQESLHAFVRPVQLLDQRYHGRFGLEVDTCIAQAVDGVTWMQRLFQALLDYLRLETQPQAYAPIQSEQALTRALANLQITMAENVAVVTHDPLPMVMADASQLVQVFQNLMANALAFRGLQPPQVHVGVERQGVEWVFTVRDNGMGLDPTHAERIFGLFQQLHPRTPYAGTGTGLAICKKIVERHNGRIWVEARPGDGATFFFTLPA